MNALLLNPSSRSKLRVAAFESGLARHGIPRHDLAPDAQDWQVVRAIEDLEIDFCVCSGTRGDTACSRSVATAMRVPTVVLDLGYIHRASGPEDPCGYNQAGWGRVGWVPAGDLDRGRWDELDTLVLPPAVPPDGGLCVLGQVAGDGQHGMTSVQLLEWLQREAHTVLADHLSWPAFFRPHPLSELHLERHVGQWPCSSGTTLAEDFGRAAGVVTYNSTAGLEAVRQGIPVWCAPTAHYAPVAREPDPVIRERHFIRLAWAQWTIDELANGEAWEFLRTRWPL